MQSRIEYLSLIKQLPHELCAIIVNLACSVNPRCACVARVAVLGVCVCVCPLYSRISCNYVKQEMLATYDMGSFVRKLEHYLLTWIGQLFFHTCTHPYMIFHYTYVHFIVGRAYYYQVRSRLFLCIVNKCAKGLHFSAFIILWLIHVHIHVCICTCTCTAY